MFPSLPKTYQRRFPFKISTTSYIYPASYTTNVKLLAPCLDEIELLFFQSIPSEAIPSEETIKELAELALLHHLTYNVHLPIDVSLADPDYAEREKAVDVVKKIIESTAPLNPSTFTLHLSLENAFSSTAGIALWQKHVYTSLKKLIDSGIPNQRLTIENLDYPMEFLERTINDLDLSVCLDIGHMLLYDFDPESMYHRYEDRIKMVHLHGVENKKDHLSLSKMDQENLKNILKIFRGYEETVSLEVFSFRDLETSLSLLEDLWFKIKF